MRGIEARIDRLRDAGLLISGPRGSADRLTAMNSRDRLFNSESLHYVLQTRAREGVSLHMDKAALATAIEMHRGDVPQPEVSVAGSVRLGACLH